MTVSSNNLRPASSNEVLALVQQLGRPLETEYIALDDALGRVLRESVAAPEDQPAFDRSAFDGFAIRRDDPGPRFRVVDFLRAGDWRPRPVQPGEAVQIATGGALPSDGLQVVMKENTRLTGDHVEVLRREAEPNIRPRGADARAGQVLVEVGTLLTPGALALLASVGHTQPCVTRLPRVLHLATGNEIIPPGQTPLPGQIRDSNSILVRAFLNQWNIAHKQLRVPEDKAAATFAIAGGQPPVADTDLLLISGGASVGEHDFTRPLLEHFGFTVHVSKTTTRPGKPLIVAQRGHALAFGLPGNPLAHFVCLNLYVRAALQALAGRPVESTSCFQSGVLATDLAAEGNARETFWPARRTWRDGAPALTPLVWSSSGDLTSLATANALIRVPAGVETLERGSRVQYVSTESMP
jgi:molybdopterin molybdotransferase